MIIKLQNTAMLVFFISLIASWCIGGAEIFSLIILAALAGYTLLTFIRIWQ